MLILPAIDLRAGKCVRLTYGDYAREKVYDEDPAAVAASFEQAGAEWLHVVDLDGAKAGEPVNTAVIEAIRKATGMKVEVGGGIRNLSSAQRLLELGVDRVIVGTRLIQDAAAAKAFFEQLGERVVAGIDTRGGLVAVQGWTEDSAESGVEFALRMQALGCRRVIFTDIAKDGALQGPNVEATRAMVQALDIPVIASGGLTSLDDVLALKEAGCEGAIVGKALYEGRLRLDEVLAIA